MGLLDDIRNLRREFANKAVELIKEKKDCIFLLNLDDVPMVRHSHNIFEGDSSDRVIRGWVGIVGTVEKTKRPLVRIVDADILRRANIFYPDQKMLNNERVCVRANTWTGYTWESLINLVGDTVDDSDIPPLFRELLYNDECFDTYEMTQEAVDNMRTPWRE